ncbi:peptide chain release factor N(5)-glutamine methyltransferase [Alloacidobacterium dinghuense]|uniref:Release factor glutamine methyltransferase n=1 Tax=Alloacidobacterium dinghuense TaxID=2763107 RepID=A0A7G8BGZ2_9BACT|nr:peptide chain release factor N(5)-glutamine methyltransferase [Alloacidobacterium dinghuense]QNI31812.1 peptide chain release factor N(5)-glutamine methyltransferase [Alloacidobacterium dinghuense]
MESTSLRRAVLYGEGQLEGIVAQPRRDAELLLLHAIKRDRAYLLMHPETELAAEQQAQYEAWLRRRAAHEPIQYILGEQEFFGLTFWVTPDVLIPRPETEHLVEAVLVRTALDRQHQIADVGTGSGAIGVALAHNLPQAFITALDISESALALARRNAETHHVNERMRFLKSDLLSAVASERFDAIVSNPPYIAEEDRATLEPQVRDYEPAAALFAGPSGMDIYERLIPQAHAALKPGGWLLIEMGLGQRRAVAQLLSGWKSVSFVDDLQGIPRVACAQRKA